MSSKISFECKDIASNITGIHFRNLILDMPTFERILGVNIRFRPSQEMSLVTCEADAKVMAYLWLHTHDY